MVGGPQERGASVTDELLREAIAVARLAPSSHNSQPWALASFESHEAVRALGEWLGVRPRSDEQWLVLALDAERALAALPSLATEMRLSCGMFLQLLGARLAEDGMAMRVIPCEGKKGLPPLADYPGAWTPLAAIAVSPGEQQVPAWLSMLASHRRTNRAPYEQRPVVTSARADLASARALFAGEEQAVSVMLIDDPGMIRTVGKFVGRHASVDFTDAKAWSETYRYIRFTERAVAASADGFGLTQLFGPLPPLVPQLLRMALSPAAMRVLRVFGAPAVMARGLGSLVGAAPLLACVSITSESRWTELVAGGVAIDMWMRATSCGLALHPVSAILQHDHIRERFQRLVGPKGRTVFFARVGYPTTSFPATSRRSLEPGDQTSGWVRL